MYLWNKLKQLRRALFPTVKEQLMDYIANLEDGNGID